MTFAGLESLIVLRFGRPGHRARRLGRRPPRSGLLERLAQAPGNDFRRRQGAELYVKGVKLRRRLARAHLTWIRYASSSGVHFHQPVGN